MLHDGLGQAYCLTLLHAKASDLEIRVLYDFSIKLALVVGRCLLEELGEIFTQPQLKVQDGRIPVSCVGKTIA